MPDDRSPDTAEPAIAVSDGVGESAGILLRWRTGPVSRDFDPGRLLVLTAMPGDEFPGTAGLVRMHVLARLRTHRMRSVQPARASRHGPPGCACPVTAVLLRVGAVDGADTPDQVHARVVADRPSPHADRRSPAALARAQDAAAADTLQAAHPSGGAPGAD